MAYKIEVNDFNFYYGEFQALTNVNLNVLENKITALIGPSGCGKSTFLRSINRMNDTISGTRAEGKLLLDGRDVYDPSIDVVDLRSRVGMVFQRPNPFPQSIFDNVAFGPRVLNTASNSDLEAMVQKSLEDVGLWEELKDKLDDSALNLSPGQQQRLCIARAAAVRPDVILMDEPASALDPVATLKIEDLMRELKKNYTIVIVTHNMQQAARASDYTAMMMLSEGSRAGTIIEYDETDVIFTRPSEQRTEDYITGRYG